MKELICLMCPESQFLDPQAEICWKTGGLYCKKLDIIVGKFDNCHEKHAPSAPGAIKKAAARKAPVKKAAASKAAPEKDAGKKAPKSAPKTGQKGKKKGGTGRKG